MCIPKADNRTIKNTTLPENRDIELRNVTQLPERSTSAKIIADLTVPLKTSVEINSPNNIRDQMLHVVHQQRLDTTLLQMQKQQQRKQHFLQISGHEDTSNVDVVKQGIIIWAWSPPHMTQAKCNSINHTH